MVLLCIGTRVVKVMLMIVLMEIPSLIVVNLKLRTSNRMTITVMPVCLPHIDGENFPKSPERTQKLALLHTYV